MISVDGVVAQLVERLVRNEKVRGSTPLGSTILRSKPIRLRAKDGVLRSFSAGGPSLVVFASSYGWQANMFYTYILESLTNPTQRYKGHTADLKQRLIDHNARRCAHTAKFVPWKVKVYVAFESLQQAQEFERYLKTGSGHAFANKHFL
jgi:putative endonuclease